MLVVVGDGFTRFEVGVNKAGRCAGGREKDNAVLLLVTVCDTVHVRRIHHVMGVIRRREPIQFRHRVG